ncbi:MAG: primase-helicase family protein [Desulfuromonadaceae bacterium]
MSENGLITATLSLKVPSPPPNWRRNPLPSAQPPQPPKEIEQAVCNTEDPVKESYVADDVPDLTATCATQTQPSNQTVTILSDMKLPEWQGSVTTFMGFTGTLPVRELKNASWSEVSSLLCPARPVFLHDKKDGYYVVPCLLKEAFLVGNTLEIAKYRGKSIFGKMRSKDHVTEASVLLIDIDGLSKAEMLICLEQLKAAKITYKAFTTFSHGSPQKPGMRVRMCIPLDRPVAPDDYSSAWRGFDQKYFGGQVSKADSSGAKLYQQQGVWSCHPSRINHAETWSYNAGVASADALLQICRTLIQAVDAASTRVDHADEFAPTATFPASIIIALLQPIDSNSPYPIWFLVIAAIFNISHGSPEGLEIADTWSSRGQKKYKGFVDVKRYWKTVRPDHPNPAKIGTLIKLAKEAGADVASIMQGEDFEECDSEGDSSDDSDPAAAQTEKSPPPVLEPLAAIQQKFGLLNISGKLCILVKDVSDERTDQCTARKLLLSNRSDGALLIERALRAEYNAGDEAPNMVKEFLVSPQTLCYMGIEFNPRGTSANYLNLWEGPTVIRQEGLWLLIQEFLYDVICDKDWDSYLYLLFYIAHALQKPEEKPGVMIILIGGQGIGKGTLGRIFQKIWSATYIQVNNIDAVVGTFNAILERAYIVFMDEALFSGNRRGTDELKSIVTEPIIQISEKYQPSRQIRSVHRFIAATNADHFKNTERDDRRDFTLRVSDVRKGDLDYWKELNEEIEYGGVEAMVHDLLAIDLSDFNVRNKPNTKELVEQKIHSLDPIQRWWHDGLFNGDIANGDKSRSDTWPDFIGTQEVIEGINAVNGGRMHKKPSAIIISQALQKLCPSAKSHQMQTTFGRHRGYLLPSLQQARAEFEKYIGGVVEWPALECAEESESHGSYGGNSECREPEF